MLGKNRWSAEKTASLAELAARGVSRREIAASLDMPMKSVAAKLRALGFVTARDPLNLPAPRRTADGDLLAAVRFPRFEDITRAEARRITQGAPPSARWTREHDFSITGNAAARCLV